jgi:hypothetical protein
MGFPVIPGRREAASPESILIIVVMDSGSWLWIPGSRQEARPGMTAVKSR